MSGIKAIIFDLHDTLFNQEQLRDSAREQAVKAMIEKGLNCTLEQGVNKLKELTTTFHASERFIQLIHHFNCHNQEIAEIGKQIYINAEFEKLIPYPEVKTTLESLKNNFQLFLVTEGSETQQNKKIDSLKVRGYFEEIFITPGDKTNSFTTILKNNNLTPNQTLIIGDRIDKEIKAGNKLGIKTIRTLNGIYKDLNPKEPLEKPHHTINNLTEIPNIINKINNCQNNQPKIVTIGGGTGTSAILEGLKKYTDNITTIVTVTDTGRSTGMIRRELNMPAPGDTRNCLLALANSEKLMYDLFQYRFENGSLEGCSFGNLFIAALTKLTGSFEKAIEEASRILKLKGKVLPSTLDNINICAELEDGNILEQEDSIIDRHNQYVYLRPKIKRVFHKPEPRLNEKILKEIEQADLIIICPGSLFTSIISNLLIKEIPEAINKSKAKTVYICNIMTQISQTHNFKASDHLRQITDYLKQTPDFVILNNKEPDKDLLDSYIEEKAFLVENNIEELKQLFPYINIIQEDILDDVKEKKLLWEKKNLLRHDPDKIGKVIMGLVG